MKRKGDTGNQRNSNHSRKADTVPLESPETITGGLGDVKGLVRVTAEGIEQEDGGMRLYLYGEDDGQHKFTILITPRKGRKGKKGVSPPTS